jgi:hypothetical protein
MELLTFLKEASIPQNILKNAEQHLNALCAQADEISSSASTLKPHVGDYLIAAARKSLVLQGSLPPLEPGETVHYLNIGNDENISETPFLDTLTAHGINTELFESQANLLVILFWRRYQAFKGKISLTEEELKQIQQASLQAKHTVLICLANPWSVSAVAAEAKILTFSPAPAFQQAAAETLVGKLLPAGRLPVVL